MPRAFITGITGQDGQHMAEFLHGKGYEIFGMVKGQNNPKGDMLRDEFPYVNIAPVTLRTCRRWSRRWKLLSQMRFTTWQRFRSWHCRGTRLN